MSVIAQMKNVSGELVEEGAFETLHDAAAWADLMMAKHAGTFTVFEFEEDDSQEAPYYRVIALSSSGSVVGTQRCSEDGIEAAHDALMELPGARVAVTVGPLA